ncbi:NfeD family protein [Ruania alba]|uniref:Membrane protein implicated in regulation of membrane protease activity n=1 Tax=Ruania alba TaxID=648782 RepID=A0A1H5EM67_9MICO|nr:Membrane protein implicated in regulation of membrane protease activity [Ruania alba]
MDLGWLWWLGAALVLGVVEMLTVDLLFLMLAGGAVAAAFAGLLGAPLWLEILVAALVSVLLLFGVRPWALAKLKSTTPDAKTGVDAQIGRPATVVADVSDRAGRVKLSGEVWTARIERTGVVLPAGTDVVVVRIEGATAYVAQPETPADPSQPYGPATQGF